MVGLSSARLGAPPHDPPARLSMSRRENPCHNGTVIAADPIDAALAAHRWDEALRLIDGAGRSGWTPPLLEQRALAAYGAGDFEGAVAAWEDQHHLLLQIGRAHV